MVAAGLLLGVVGCGQRVTALEIEDLEFDFGFFVITDDDGVAVRTTDPFARSKIRADPSAAPSVVLVGRERGYVFVTLDVERLRATVPAFDPSRAGELATQVGAPPLGPTNVTDIVKPTVRLAIPADARFYGSALDDAVFDRASLESLEATQVRAREGVTLIVPVDPEYCRIEDQTPLVSWAADERPFASLFSSVPEDQYVRRVRFLDDTHVLVATGHGLFVAPKGGTVVTSTAGYTFVRESPGGELYDRIARFGLGPTRPDGSRELIVVGGFENRPELMRPDLETYGKFWLFDVVDGQLRQRGPATRVDVPLTSVAIHADGRAIIGGKGGVTLVRTSTSASFVRSELPLVEDELVNGVALPLERRPFVFASHGRFHDLHPATGRWHYQDVLQPGVNSAELLPWVGFDAEVRGDDAEFFATARRGFIVRRTSVDASWQRYEPARYPPRFAACSSNPNADGDLLFERAIMDVAIEGGFLHMTYHHCDMVVQHRLSDGCISLHTREGRAPAFDETGLVSLDARPGELVAVTRDGRVWTSTRPVQR